MERKYPLKKYQIWLGNHYSGQGDFPSSEPVFVGESIGPSFKVACLLYELREKVAFIEKAMLEDRDVDEQSCHWFYDFNKNANSWTGRYFETKEKAQETFR